MAKKKKKDTLGTGVLTSCSRCFKPIERHRTVIMEGKRVCHDCKSGIYKGRLEF